MRRLWWPVVALVLLGSVALWAFQEAATARDAQCTRVDANRPYLPSSEDPCEADIERAKTR
jgi:hypothetical protein